mmetsp:Transcript_94844/g.283241  ORF Transcript_94844/g.283241 Transcript_94844/m.283241 type:complete len:104 (-) Transcript_94844:14-325(-)
MEVVLDGQATAETWGPPSVLLIVGDRRGPRLELACACDAFRLGTAPQRVPMSWPVVLSPVVLLWGAVSMPMSRVDVLRNDFPGDAILSAPPVRGGSKFGLGST